MRHRNRIWCLRAVASAEELARILTEEFYDTCAAFYILTHENYLFLNDEVGPDDSRFAIVHGGVGAERHVEIATLFPGIHSMLANIQHAIAGEYDDRLDMGDRLHPQLELPDEHRDCPFCEGGPSEAAA